MINDITHIKYKCFNTVLKWRLLNKKVVTVYC